jgi:NitT/TauT family transport system substrate-binding protein
LKKTIITAIIIVLIIIGTIILVNLDNNTNDENVTKGTTLVRVNEVTRSVFYAPQYAAIALGYFEDYGIEIELTNGGGADNVMTAVLSGQSDIGFAGPEAAIYVYNEGKADFPQVFAQLTKRDGSFLVSRENTDNFSWQDLKGKVVIPGRKGGVLSPGSRRSMTSCMT